MFTQNEPIIIGYADLDNLTAICGGYKNTTAKLVTFLQDESVFIRISEVNEHNLYSVSTITELVSSIDNSVKFSKTIKQEDQDDITTYLVGLANEHHIKTNPPMFTLPKYLSWEPKADITVHELAQCLPILTNSDFKPVQIVLDTTGPYRHFVKHPEKDVDNEQ